MNHDQKTQEEKEQLEIRLEKFHEFCRWLNNVTGHDVRLDALEFAQVFDHYVERSMQQRIMYMSSGDGREKTYAEAANEFFDWATSRYEDAHKTVARLIENTEGKCFDWSSIRRFVASWDSLTIWVVSLRMCHLAGDFGEWDIERARQLEADRLQAQREGREAPFAEWAKIPPPADKAAWWAPLEDDS